MALDASTIHILASELEESLNGSRVEKISMPSRDEAVFFVRCFSGRKQLLLSARSGSARVHFTSEEFDYPVTPPGFCMLLRKYLLNSRIIGVDTIPGDRVLLIHFDSINEMGERVSLLLSVEMMGRYSNLVLVDGDGIIVDALKRIDDTQSEKRQLLPGLEFVAPPVPDKKNFLLDNIDDLADEIISSPKFIPDAVLQKVSGLSPLLCREAGLGLEDVAASDASVSQKTLLKSNLIRLREPIESPEKRRWTLVFDGERMVEFSYLDLFQYNGLRKEVYGTASELFDRYYSAKDRELRLKNRSQDLSRQVRQLLDRSIRKQDSRREELGNTDKADQKRLFGELLTANLNAFHKGDNAVSVLNYYTGERVTIPLDVTRSPNGNAQKYYKEYRKLRTAAEVLKRLLAEGEQEQEYLRQVAYDITQAKTEEDFIEIRKDLKESGFLRGFKYKQKGKRRTEPFFRYITTGGYEVLVGKNNAANERLSLSVASGRDLWFHIKGAAGSHVILRTMGNDPDDVSMTEACEIAAYHSSQPFGQLVPVDYTEARRVRKIPGGKTGMVSYTDQKTAYVTPDEGRVLAKRVK